MWNKFVRISIPVAAAVSLALLLLLTLKVSDLASQSKALSTDVSTIASDTEKQTGKQLATQIQSSNFQSVFLDSGQVYFGKLHELNAQYFSLTDVYYLQDLASVTNGGTKAGTVDGVALIKLGTELHGPKDNMLIAQSKVMFIENLKDNSKVVKAIKSYESKH